MSRIAIQFEDVGKLYRLGRVGTGSFAHDLNRWWQTRILGKEDPYLKIGETNDRTKRGNSDYVWALRDITFEVETGDVVGIIGRNGAGKSTLLKLLSQVTAPTTGVIRYNGRIASLLEVGTGFHPELTGRENIYLNGSILGMTRAEITRKLDEIVDFSGVERYIDTPTKRYSSGMMVRLGFAVAAFLEPEILVVDEVLAVGDAEFQKKAIGKMQDVSKGEGRTVLFVSHNMASIQSLCKSGIVLKNGCVDFSGSVDDAVNYYMQDAKIKENGKIADAISMIKPGVTIESIKINNQTLNVVDVPPNAKFIEVEIKGHVDDECPMNLIFRIKTRSNTYLATFNPHHFFGTTNNFKGDFVLSEKIKIPSMVATGSYICDIMLWNKQLGHYLFAYECAEINFGGNSVQFGEALTYTYHGFTGLERYID